MSASPALSVVIIRGGFSGCMTLLQLARKAEKKVHITLFYNTRPLIRGLAFQTYSDQHLLNVAARNMSAFPEQPEHFVLWLKKREEFSLMDTEAIGKLYLPRNLFGSYLDEILNNTLEQLSPHISYELIRNEVTSVEVDGDSFLVRSADGTVVRADKVVLASGNQRPSPPFKGAHPFLDSSLYFPDPWTEASVSDMKSDEPVLIIGTGLTMVDVVLGLLEKNFTGKIIAISPKGFHILPHRPNTPYTDILQEIKAPYDLGKLFHIFRAHVRRVKAENRSGETVVDALRSKTQEVWQGLSPDDRKRFMVHLRHLWGVARHRLPAGVHELMQQLILKGKLEILAGRITNAELHSGFATVHYKSRKDQESKTLVAQRIINCTGPEADPSKFDSPLFRQLLIDKIITVDDMHLGIKATADGVIYGAGNETSTNIFALGSLLRGTLWETTAVPELRVQAEKSAALILKS